eukprot:3038816-Pyramimonas_sp.AAC.2
MDRASKMTESMTEGRNRAGGGGQCAGIECCSAIVRNPNFRRAFNNLRDNGESIEMTLHEEDNDDMSRFINGRLTAAQRANTSQ